ncbi:MAG: SH3 domain-containing protein [Lachnospiraceae bacterium]|nr:SH3 domain-containing protein [Lachnospiraceae bacterium]
MKKKILTSIRILALVSITCMAVGCEKASDPERTEIKEKTEKEEVSVSEPEKEAETDQEPSSGNDSENISAEDTEQSDKNDDDNALPDVSESQTEASDNTDEWWPKYDSPEDVLDKYMEEQEVSPADDMGYLMYDVDADGFEEMIITYQDRIAEIYGNYKGKLHLAFTAYADCEATLYPGGMLKVVASDQSEYTETTWEQYYPEFGDFLPVFEEMDGQYYTFCAYDLDENDMKEINRSLEDIGEYPVWIGEWFDMITKSEYDKLIPKTEPVKLLKADPLSDRSALEVKEQFLLFVKASDGYANLRTGPGTEYEIICQIPNGDDMEMYRKNAMSDSGKKWLKVTYLMETDNEAGYSWLTGWVAESQLE